MDESKLTAILDDRVAGHEFSGVAMAWSEGDPVFAYAGGLAHRGLGVPNTVDTRFHVASITKMVTAAVALRLVEQGVLSLDRPLFDVLPEPWRPASLTPAHTLHHLLSHTSGIANYHDVDDETFESFKECWRRIPPQDVRGSADVLPLFTDLPSRFGPGEDFEYADANYLMIGLLIEAATGKPFVEVAGFEVLERVGMSSSSFADVDLDPPGMAVGYMLDDGPADSWRSNVYAIPAGGLPDGGMITTAADLCRFVDAFNDGRLVRPGTRAQMLTSYGRINEDAEDYGYGMEMFMKDGVAAIFGHAGGDPGVSGILSHYVEAGVTTVVLCNYDSGAWAAAGLLAEALGIEDPRE